MRFAVYACLYHKHKTAKRFPLKRHVYSKLPRPLFPLFSLSILLLHHPHPPLPPPPSLVQMTCTVFSLSLSLRLHKMVSL